QCAPSSERIWRARKTFAVTQGAGAREARKRRLKAQLDITKREREREKDWVSKLLERRLEVEGKKTARRLPPAHKCLVRGEEGASAPLARASGHRPPSAATRLSNRPQPSGHRRRRSAPAQPVLSAPNRRSEAPQPAASGPARAPSVRQSPACSAPPPRPRPPPRPSAPRPPPPPRSAGPRPQRRSERRRRRACSVPPRPRPRPARSA
ncbi:unnamed protein product, partial [Ectocarpus sp. 12 AP-2014]